MHLICVIISIVYKRVLMMEGRVTDIFKNKKDGVLDRSHDDKKNGIYKLCLNNKTCIKGMFHY